MLQNRYVLLTCSLCCFAGATSTAFWQTTAPPRSSEIQVNIPNDQIDEAAFLKSAGQAIHLRKQRRLTEAQFIDLAKQPKVIVLDARSKDRFQQVHIRGAINLPFTDITFDSLAKVLPDKNAKILIYCNNNFRGNTPEFQSKSPGAALNLSTFSSLYEYGYRNIYELGPAVDIKSTQLPLVGENAEAIKKAR